MKAEDALSKKRTAGLNAVTDRVPVKDELKASLREVNDLRAAINEHAIVAIADPQGRIIFVNDKLCAISKYSREELLGQDHRFIHLDFHPKDLMCELWTTISRGDVWHGEIRNRAKDGVFYWVDMTIMPFLNDEGKPRQYVAICTDITARKMAEEALYESEELFAKSFRLSPDCMAISRISDRTVIRANDALCALWGSTPEEVIGKPALEYVTWVREEERLAFLMVLQARGECLNWDTSLRLADGRMLDFNISARMITYRGDSCVLSVMRDVSERKQAEAAVRESEEQFRTMVDAISQLAWIAKPDGFIHWYNQRWFEYTGTTPEQMEGWGWQRVHDPEILPTVLERWKASIATGEPFEMDFPLRAADGSYRWFLTRAFPLKDPSGRVLRWCGTNTDVSKMREAEREIQRLNRDLEQRVIERTAQLEAANKELEAFSYSVSHVLRSPLRAVDGFSQAVLDDYGPVLPEEGQRFLQTIRQGAQKMGMLIDDLLTFSRLGRAPLNKQTVHTGPLVRSVLEDLSAQREGRQIEVRIGELPPCLCDPALLRQVWLNLVSNALKYTRKREPAVIEIGCEQKRDGDVWFVRDNGTGFDMRYADKLFGVFQRLHLAEDYEGTGVGLALVQRIIHRHGGRVWADAAVDRGATFYFTLEGATKS